MRLESRLQEATVAPSSSIVEVVFGITVITESTADSPLTASQSWSDLYPTLGSTNLGRKQLF